MEHSQYGRSSIDRSLESPADVNEHPAERVQRGRNSLPLKRLSHFWADDLRLDHREIAHVELGAEQGHDLIRDAKCLQLIEVTKQSTMTISIFNQPFGQGSWRSDRRRLARLSHRLSEFR